MRFDDRLTTVLAQPVASPHDRAVRWRQLVDLVARSGGEGDRDLLDRALDLIRRDARSIREPLRAATARAIAGHPVPVALLCLFASDKLSVAAPLLAPAVLEGEALEMVRAAASPDVRRFLNNLHPQADVTTTTDESPPVLEDTPPLERPTVGGPQPIPSISEVVARIEKVRAVRQPDSAQTADLGSVRQALEADTPYRPAPTAAPKALETIDIHPESPSIFRWECNPDGEIEWVDGVPRGALVGRSIAVADTDEGVDECVERAFSIRAPFRDCQLELGDVGQAGGRWTISGAPAFAPNGGRFIGYRGIARREDATDVRQPDPTPYAEDHDALREMIHEIRTPLNAIIGFAEIIDGQYFGPAHRRYRERAAEIVTNARSLLMAAEDLDVVARLQSRRSGPSEGTDFDSFFPDFAVELIERGAKAGVTVDLDVPDRGGRCTLDPELTSRLLLRFTDALIGAASEGERLVVHVHKIGDRCAMSVTRPRATIMATKEDLLDPEFTIGEKSRDLLGLGFSMRLVNGLASLAGGGLEINDSHFTLFVPLKHD